MGVYVVEGQGFGEATVPLAVFTHEADAEAWAASYNTWPDRAYTAIVYGAVPFNIELRQTARQTAHETPETES